MQAESSAELEDVVRAIHAKAEQLQRAKKDREAELYLRQAQPLLDLYEQLVVEELAGHRAPGQRPKRKPAANYSLFIEE